MKENNNNNKKTDGIIFLSGPIDNNMTDKICKKIIELNMENKTPFIQIIINSSGGYCSAGFAIIDIIEWSEIPVYTTGIGMIASMGLLIFMTGQHGKRVVTPRTSILSHRYSGSSIGNHSQLVATRREEDLMHQRIINHYMQHSNLKDENELNKKLLRDVDTWLSPEEAKTYGLVDYIQYDKKIEYPNYKIKK